MKNYFSRQGILSKYLKLFIIIGVAEPSDPQRIKQKYFFKSTNREKSQQKQFFGVKSQYQLHFNFLLDAISQYPSLLFQQLMHGLTFPKSLFVSIDSSILSYTLSKFLSHHYNSSMNYSLKSDAGDSSLSNTFSMKRVTETNAPTVVVDFTPAPQTLIGCGGSSTKAHPVFNNDRYYFTPTFMLHQDKLKTEGNLQVFLDLHQKRLLETVEEKQEIMVPRPSKAHSFCCVCKKHYEDYLNHIAEEGHLGGLEKSKFRKEINKLCKKFVADSRKIAVEGKNKPIRKRTLKKESKNYDNLKRDEMV